MAKNDKVVVTVDLGQGQWSKTEVVADAAGRTVEFVRDKRDGTVIVEVRGRAGTLARKVEFRADRVIAIEEVPA